MAFKFSNIWQHFVGKLQKNKPGCVNMELHSNLPHSIGQLDLCWVVLGMCYFSPLTSNDSRILLSKWTKFACLFFLKVWQSVTVGSWSSHWEWEPQKNSNYLTA